MNAQPPPSAADLAALCNLPGACRCGHAPEAHGSDGCRWHHISQGEPCGCVHFIEARSMPSLTLTHAIVAALDGNSAPLAGELYAIGGKLLADRAVITMTRDHGVLVDEERPRWHGRGRGPDCEDPTLVGEMVLARVRQVREESASETHIDTSDPSAAVDASRPSEPRIEVRANGRALVLTIPEAQQLREQLDAALEPARYPHGRGCYCPQCE